MLFLPAKRHAVETLQPAPLEIAPPWLGDEGPLFGNTVVPGAVPARGLALSLGVHCLFILLLAQLPNLGLLFNDEEVKLYVAAVQPLSVRAPEPLYYTAPPRPAPPAQRPDAPQNRPGHGISLPAAPSLPEPAPAPPKPVAPTRRLELPAVARPKPETQILLQPPDPARVHAPIPQLPKLVAWASQAPVVPRPKPKAFVTPGRREDPPARPAELAAPPKLDAPNREYALSDINMGRMPPNPRPALRLPPSRTAPVRVLDAPPEVSSSRGGGIASAEGDPANMVILSSNVPKVNEIYTVPPGSNAPSPSAESQQGNGHGNGAGTASPNRGGTANGSAGGNGPAGGTPGATAGNGPPAGAAAPPTQLAGGILLSPAPGAMPAAAPRRAVMPKTGAFDVVVVQSSPPETVLRTVGVLKGKPVYTVYLQLGTSKAWILQYCLPPNAAPIDAGTHSMQLSEPSPVTPPYPIAVAVSEVEMARRSSYTLIHGYLTAEGKFRNLGLVGRVDSEMSRVVSLLGTWEFRPATKDGKPVEVEILLAIPPKQM